MGIDEDKILNDLGELSRQASINHLFQQAVNHLQQGNLDEAGALTQRILDENPDHAEASNLLGHIAIQNGQYDLADSLILRALKHDPHASRYHFNRGIALERLGRLEESRTAYEQAIRYNPDFAEAHQNLGNLFRAQGKLDQASACYMQAAALRPADAEMHYNLGLVCTDQGNIQQALDSFQKAVALRPGFAEGHNGLGLALLAQGEEENACACFRRAVSLKPDFAGAYYNLGALLKERGNVNEAMACFRQAVALSPDFALAHCSIGNILKEQGCEDRALKCYQQALLVAPDVAAARWAVTMTQIPAIYEHDQDPLTCRDSFSCKLDALDRWFNADNLDHGYKCVGSQQPFFLAYQEQNNRGLLSRYGKLCVQLMKHWMDKQDFTSRVPAGGEIIRVGIVSAYLYDHSVWNALVKGWFRHLDRKRFELHVFHLGTRRDSETAWAQRRSASFVQGRKSTHQWVEIMLDKQPDVLIYPEIGMDPMTVRLASLRLAPVQITTWGHPETSGFPTMDYYLSAEDFEFPDAQNNYTEYLVSLPHLGCCYQPLQVTATQPDLTRLGIDPDSPLLLCAGAPFKYAPGNDQVFTEIARRLGYCQLVFFTHGVGELSAKLHQRFELAFRHAGLEFNNYACFIPWQERSAFYGLMRQADVYLDTIGFSGFNTAMQAVACTLPVVTREGRFLRGRLASGVLRRMAIPELIAGSEEDYIALTVRLVEDAGFRKSICHRMERARKGLYGDLAPIRALEDFLVGVVRR